MRAVPEKANNSPKAASAQPGLAKCLKAGEVLPRFLYESPEQTARWLAVRQSCSPQQQDPDCRAIYEAAFAYASQELQGQAVHVVGLGCGDGSKEALFLRALAAANCPLYFTAIDIGPGMVEAALKQAGEIIAPDRCAGMVRDVSHAQDLAHSLANIESQWVANAHPIQPRRACTFFGMMPVLKSDEALFVLKQAVRPRDTLLVSANMAPGDDYQAGMERVLPQYDNTATREWLLGFLESVGVSRNLGELKFAIEEESETRRITARFTFTKPARVRVENEMIHFTRGSGLRLFQSFRHTPRILRSLLETEGFKVREQWVTLSGEEGLFLVERLQ